MKRIGIDIGSTTIKCVVLDENKNILFSIYERHYAYIKEKFVEVLTSLVSKSIIKKDEDIYIGISGSAGMGISEILGIPFTQEVYATKISATTFLKHVDCIIELGGEDAKIIFLSDGNLEIRMNGTCAGGTGSFIDQMAVLLHVETTQINELAQRNTKLYTIASRCGVFAKTDVQPLINQGALKEDIAASILKAVVNQTIGGLAQGREIKGDVVYLGGPLTFISALRESFDHSLKLKGLLPENSLYFVAIGASLCAEKHFTLADLISKVTKGNISANYSFSTPLFNDENELQLFRDRHSKNKVETFDLIGYTKPLFLGVDSGSTTLKVVLIDEKESIRFQKYVNNEGNPIALLLEILKEIYTINPAIDIRGSVSTGYGEEISREAFNFDYGIVETMAHFYAARKFNPEVSFVIDIGGQDIKCFKIENGAITNIFLNEACSSGCGSFLQTFATALGTNIAEFAQVGLLAKKPVDLGSRCTVFMNSSVKQAQKDGATIDNISAGLSQSVVKNALYKVIRLSNTNSLGKNVVVQGGTFYNEAVLRAFEREIGQNVVRPNIAGLMGAYGAALKAKSLGLEKSSILSKEELDRFEHKTMSTKCGLCTNNCNLSINTFSNGRRFISGNRCEKPLASKNDSATLNIYNYIQNKLLTEFTPKTGKNGRIGIPLGLNNYELYPYWYAFFTSLGFEVHHSGFSNYKVYLKGQSTIPSDTACYPAKVIHGHVISLIEDGFKNIWYPCMSYNIDEGLGDNNYNCPVVAYYPETILNNTSLISERNVNFIRDYVGITNPTLFAGKVKTILKKRFSNVKFTTLGIRKAINAAMVYYKAYMEDIRAEGKRIIEEARSQNMPIVVLSGRPYHVDPGINHGIDRLIRNLGVAIINEESVSHLTEPFHTNVVNQWTYHSRMYAAAKYITTQDDMYLIQLVSFGCGLDAVTSDEVRLMLESHDNLYTLIKIDEITNLGAVKIRVRSLLETIKGDKK